MSDIHQVQRRQPSELLERPSAPFGAELPRRSVEARQVAQNDRQAIVRARELANEAALADLKNEMSHQLKLNETQRRARRATDVMHAAGTLMNMAQTIAGEYPARQMELLDIYNAWKQGEIHRIVTD